MGSVVAVLVPFQESVEAASLILCGGYQDPVSSFEFPTKVLLQNSGVVGKFKCGTWKKGCQCA